MFSAFRMGPAASARGLCDIDRVYLGGPQKKYHKNWEVLFSTAKLDR